MWPFNGKAGRLKNVYKVTYIPCAEIDEAKGEVVCRLCNMREAYVEAENPMEAQKAFADFRQGKVSLSPHVYIDRIVEVVHRVEG